MGRRFTSVKGIDAFGKVRLSNTGCRPGSKGRGAGRVELTGFRCFSGALMQTMEDVKIKTGFGGLRESLLRRWVEPLGGRTELTWARECAAYAYSHSRIPLADPQSDHLRVCRLPEGAHGTLRGVGGGEQEEG